ncbi:TRAP transporter small permease [Effusibacillus lacus]|uniref:C4-dicarboxylate ABC transporter permease n=1 Tax=Effusibacillus lacus TaxID=1348429 RepID=A0A292YGS4_9BACL|nr:TRAP transporter small permease [Effusibacillus lacus]TCS67851.1 TRAP-type C4-dicarboxylate transport system permease small subunit [Effusibacillus lacus]GAX89827.1 C4-dicarboxylate ABC transporter permease [Effusibacillus lacus]
MRKISKAIGNLLNVAIAFSLGIMCILVFINVVLRYVFNSGITWSEEIAPILFIWLVFLGSIAALKDNQHLGVDMFVKKLPRGLKKTVFLISSLLVLYCLWLLLDGSWKITVLNMDSKAPATGLPLSFVYGIGIITSIGMGIIILFNIYQVLTGKKSADELMTVQESEELLDPTMKQ